MSAPKPEDDPEFYCHGQACLDRGCDPLHCADEPDDWMTEGLPGG